MKKNNFIVREIIAIFTQNNGYVVHKIYMYAVNKQLLIMMIWAGDNCLYPHKITHIINASDYSDSKTPPCLHINCRLQTVFTLN